MRSFSRALALLASSLLGVSSMDAFQSPLSDESIREAYFLGQRHDAHYLTNYIKFLPMPSTGPHIYSIAFLTPFAQLVQFSSSYIGNYSAQRARLDHLHQHEVIKIVVEIRFTESYGAFLPEPVASSSRRSPTPSARPHDFWKDFQVQVYDGKELLSPSVSGGRARSACGRFGPCQLIGAALELEFPPSAFSDTATIKVIPPKGEAVNVNFDLGSIR